MAFPSGGVGFRNPVATPQGLVLPWIKSPNFLSGSTGWIIRRDGSAEFNNLTVRGTLILQSSTQGIFLYSGTPALGNLIMSIASAAGTDAFGNNFVQGFAMYSGSAVTGQWSQTNQSLLLNSVDQKTLIGLVAQAAGAFLEYNPGVGVGGGYQAGSINAVLTGIVGNLQAIVKMTGPVPTGGTAPFFELASDTPTPAAGTFAITSADNVQVTSKQYDPVNHTAPTGTLMADTGWTALTLNAPYQRFSSSFHTPSYNVLSNGLVKLRGDLNKSTAAALVSGDVPFNLPAGIRPLATEIFMCGSESLSAGLGVRLDINAAGAATLVFNQTGYTPHWFSIDNVIYSIV